MWLRMQRLGLLIWYCTSRHSGPQKGLPENWKAALNAWMRGEPSAVVVALCSDEGVDVLQEAFTYRLPWAMEAVRVHALAMGLDAADSLSGLAALAAESGTANRSAMVLLCAGLNSREAAIAAVNDAGANFDDRGGMLNWLSDEDVRAKNTAPDLADRSEPARVAPILAAESGSERREWSWETQIAEVSWTSKPPAAGTPVIVEPVAGGQSALVLSPAFDRLGMMKGPLKRHQREIAWATADDKVSIRYFGADTRR